MDSYTSTSTAFSYQDRVRAFLESNDGNVLVVAPTGAGKTTSGFDALEVGGLKGVYLAPTRALCFEKAQELMERFPGARVAIGNKDYGLGRDMFRGVDICVMTPWKLNVLMAVVPDFARYCPVVVIDEAHGLSSDIEMIITKLKVLFPSIRIIALSATVHEDDRSKFSNWLEATTFLSEERPVPLVERVVRFEPDLTDEGEEVTTMTISEFGSKAVAYDQVNGSLSRDARLWAIWQRIQATDRGPVLIWTPYRKAADAICSFFAERIQQMGDRVDNELADAAATLEGSGETGAALKNSLPWGVAMHHGGLTQNERELVYNLASVAGSKIQVLVTCMTLSKGVNLPARHVIFESLHDWCDGEKRLIDISQFRQIEGRAGRPQFDEVGFAWIPVGSEIEQVEVEEVLLKYKASRLESRVYDEYFLTSQLPGLIRLGFNTPERLIGFLMATFWGTTLQDTQPLCEQMERIISLLCDRKVSVAAGSRLHLTPKGEKVARLGVHVNEFETIEALTSNGSLEYAAWVRGLGGCLSQDEQDLADVVAYGLTIYSASGIKSAARDLADNVQRLLDVTNIYFGICRVDDDYCRGFRSEVSERFMYGNLTLARHLAPTISRDSLKRIVRNLGDVLKKHPSSLTRDDHNLLAAALYAHQQHDSNPGGTEGVAQALEISHDEWLFISMPARARFTRPNPAQEGGEAA